MALTQMLEWPGARSARRRGFSPDPMLRETTQPKFRTIQSRLKPLLHVVLTGLVLQTAIAQEAEPPTAVLPPDPRALAADWWRYIGEAEESLQERTGLLLDFASEALKLYQEQTESIDEDSGQYLDRLRLNLSALPDLRAQNGQTAEPVPPSAPEYRVDEYLQIERELRKTRRARDELDAVISRNRESARIAERRVDNLMAAYLALPSADPVRLRRGLQIMASRSGLAIARQQLRVREETRTGLNNRVEQLELLLDQASDAIIATPEELAEVDNRLQQLRAQLEETQAELQERRARALGAQGETPLEQARNSWRSQRVIVTEAREAELTLEIARRGLEQSWFSIALTEADDQPQLSTAQERLGNVEDLLRLTRAELDAWEEQSERELVALRAFDPQGAPQALQRVNRQRVDAANESLRNIAQARSIAEDTELVADLLRKRISAEQGVVVGGFSSIWSYFERAWDQTRNWLATSLFKIGETPVTAFGIMRVAFIVFIAIWISRLLRHALNRIGARGEGTQSAFYTVGRLLHYVIIAASIVIGLSSIGLSFANLAIVAGALGVGIGFGLQSIVNNFVSGLILLFERSLKVGDYVELESGVGGVVREINVRSTLINTNQNLDILVPNSEFVSGRLINWTHKESSRRMHIKFGVAYGTDKELVKKAALEAAAAVTHTVKDNPLKRPDVWLTNFGDSSLDFELVIWVKQASVRRPAMVQSLYMWEIESALGRAGIEIPFPQRDLHIRSGLHAAATTAADGNEN